VCVLILTRINKCKSSITGDRLKILLEYISFFFLSCRVELVPRFETLKVYTLILYSCGRFMSDRELNVYTPLYYFQDINI